MLWCGTPWHRYFCTPKLGHPKNDIFLIPLGKCLNLMLGRDHQDRFLSESKLMEFSFWRLSNWRLTIYRKWLCLYLLYMVLTCSSWVSVYSDSAWTTIYQPLFTAYQSLSTALSSATPSFESLAGLLTTISRPSADFLLLRSLRGQIGAYARVAVSRCPAP